MRRVILAAPAFWLLAFFILPLLIIFKISLSTSVMAAPPYAPTFEWGDPASWGAAARGFSLAAYRGLIEDPLYLEAYLTSLALAGAATICAVCLAIPFALAIARAAPRWRLVLLGLAVAPFWTSFLIRVYAWIALLKDEGLINNFLRAIGVIDAPLPIFATNWAVLIGMVYSYLPFVVLPIYNAFAAQDSALGEAAADLGAGPLTIFRTITLPLAAPGVAAGAALMFIPAIGEFIIPDLLGGSDSLLIGRVVWNDFFYNRDWPQAAAGAVALFLLLIGPILYFERRAERAS